MELLFDYLRVANAFEVRMKAELRAYQVNELQMWLLLLIGGLLRLAMRGRKSLSANEAAIELGLPRTRIANQMTSLSRRSLVVPIDDEPSADGRNESFVLSDEGLDLARKLRKLLQTIEKDVLVEGGWRTTDREVDPQYLVMGFWLTGGSRGRLPTMTRLQNAPADYAAGDERGEDVIRLKKVSRCR